ncbi:MAG: B12-binding domain-containing radical SAM protein [Lachnospiraceae bacterium]|nr:B12-binding domain-containing radical SAM protein [Lachnospiraceae bacterium]
MKFLLVALNAKYIHSNPALHSLKAYAGEEYSDSIELAEYTINNESGTILADLYKRQPDVVGFSCYIWNRNMLMDLVGEFHKLMPGVPIWLGGPEVSFDARNILDEKKEVTGIMIGEGEETFLQLLKYYIKEVGFEDLGEIQGIVTRDNEYIKRPLLNMDTLPFLYSDLSAFENRILYYESSRGCPFRCSYCLSSVDKTVRVRNFTLVKKELQFFLDHKVPQVKFVDRTFNCVHEHTMNVWQYILENDNGVTNFHFEVEADILRPDELELLSKMRPGLCQLEIGVQTTNPVTLKEIRRHMDIEKLRETVKTILSYGTVHVHLDLIAGLPYEDYISFSNSFNEVYSMKPQQLQLGFLKVLKGAYMHEKAEDYGIAYLDKPPYEVLFTKWLTFEEVIKLKRIEEMVEIYYNSNQFTHTLPVLEREFETPFELYEKLAAFYEKKGYFVKTPSRMYRYDVLLEFVMTVVSQEESTLYRELLIFDIYLRENVKSRPQFASLLANDKEIVRTFYEKEVENPQYLTGYEQFDAKQMARMTHLEKFSYPVWNTEYEAVIEPLKEERYVLFDYKEGNPLTYEAKYTGNLTLA